MGSLAELARRLRPYIEKAVQSLPDTDAVEAVELYPVWRAGMAYDPGHKLSYCGRLYRVRDGQGHTSQVGWEPDKAPALFEGINETHTGTKGDPIPYGGNMVLEEGKYYTQDGVVYRCVRDTISPVYHRLADLVGLYVIKEE